MEQCRRNRLRDVNASATTHPGLWLDKYLRHQLVRNEPVPAGETTPQNELLIEVAGLPESEAYRRFYSRWEEGLGQVGAVTRRAAVRGRLSIGLGAESVLETAISLHRTYGVPYIPGSSLKGLAARYAHRRLADPRWREGGEAYRVLCGDTKEAGFVAFFDALYIPGTGQQGHPLHKDVITVHHPDYYASGKKAPADWDNPNPVAFLSATGSYLLALAGDSAWVQTTYEILALALLEEGIGAKTSSGYGRMVLEVGALGAGNGGRESESGEGPGSDPDQPQVDSFLFRLKNMSSQKVAGEILGVANEWRALTIGVKGKRTIALAMLDKVEASGRTRKSVEQQWFKELLAFLAEHPSA